MRELRIVLLGVGFDRKLVLVIECISIFVSEVLIFINLVVVTSLSYLHIYSSDDQSPSYTSRAPPPHSHNTLAISHIFQKVPDTYS